MNAYYLSSDGTKIALGAVGEGRFHVIVLNERGEQVMGSDLAEPVVRVAIAGLNEKLVVLTQRHVSQFDIESQQIEWQAAARGRTLTVSQPGTSSMSGACKASPRSSKMAASCGRRTLYLCRRLWPIAITLSVYRQHPVVVIRFDGSILGTVSPLAPIRDFAVATDAIFWWCWTRKTGSPPGTCRHPLNSGSGVSPGLREDGLLLRFPHKHYALVR